MPKKTQARKAAAAKKAALSAKKDAPAKATAAKKRSIARRYNDALAGRSPKVKRLDQRVARKLRRYRNELKKNSTGGGKQLSALEVAKRVHALLENGDRITDIRKLSKPRQYEYHEDKMVALLAEMHAVYGFCPEAYRFAGVRNETLVGAGVLKELPPRRGPRPKKR